MNYSVVVVAAGKSERFESSTNKLLYKLSNGKKVIEQTLEVFLQDDDCKQVIVVTSPEVLEDLITSDAMSEGDFDFKPVYCNGGATRSASVKNGLMAVTEDIVFVHDGARCYLMKEDLEALKSAMETERAAMLVHDETDSIKKVEDGYVVGSLNRDEVKRAQTPQAFYTDDLIRGYRKAFADEFVATDDAGIMERYSAVSIKCVKAQGNNEKVTTIRDIK